MGDPTENWKLPPATLERPPRHTTHWFTSRATEGGQVFLVDERPTRLVFTWGSIRVGCHIVSVEAAKELLAAHARWLGDKDEFVVQEGAKLP